MTGVLIREKTQGKLHVMMQVVTGVIIFINQRMPRIAGKHQELGMGKE